MEVEPEETGTATLETIWGFPALGTWLFPHTEE